MNFSKKSTNEPVNSKNIAEKSFQQLFKKINSNISNENLEKLHVETQNINDAALNIFDKIMDLISQREQKMRNENEEFKKTISEVVGNLEEKMGETLQDTIDKGSENLENWRVVAEKKENYENMHQSLLQMKKSVLPVNFFKK